VDVSIGCSVAFSATLWRFQKVHNVLQVTDRSTEAIDKRVTILQEFEQGREFAPALSGVSAGLFFPNDCAAYCFRTPIPFDPETAH
jgi:hypothetical protein